MMKEVIDLIDKYDAILIGLIGTKSYFDEQYSERKSRLVKEMGFACNGQLEVVVLTKMFLDHIETTRTNDANIINKYNDYIDSLKGWVTQFATNEGTVKELQEQLEVYDKNNRALIKQNKTLNTQADQYEKLLNENRTELLILKGMKKDEEKKEEFHKQLKKQQHERMEFTIKKEIDDANNNVNDDGDDSDEGEGSNEEKEEDEEEPVHISPAQAAIDELIKDSPKNFFNKQVFNGDEPNG